VLDGRRTALVNLRRYPPRFRYLPKIIEFLGYVPEYSTTEKLVERIVTHRKRLGLSQKGLARLLDVDPSTLAKWEQGKRTPKGLYLEKVRAFFARCDSIDGGTASTAPSAWKPSLADRGAP
jgi:DNA-binding XRE family transcriptional regulator